MKYPKRCVDAILVMALLAPFSAWSAARTPYRTEGTCDGFAAVPLHTPAALCVGLVAQNLGFARGVTVIDHDVFVIDMGGWGSKRGRLLRLADDGHRAPVVVLGDLDQPNAVVPGPQRTLYVGATGRVLQVDPYAAEPRRSVRVVVTGLPTSGRHPIPSLAVGTDGALFVNVGSATDNCQPAGGRGRPDPAAPCPETLEHPPRGSILRFPSRNSPWNAAEQAPYAQGLRNSMALAILPDGRVAAASNARDFINQAAPGLSDAELPHDTLSVVQPSGDYGWPYCYDMQRASPEYPAFDCHSKLAPDRLLPAHAAPLGMLLYRGTGVHALPGLDGKLVIGLHGYRATGHRLVAVALDAVGRPTGTLVELVGGWDEAPGRHPQGAPVGVAEMADGSVLIAEDHNGSLLRLSRATGK